MSDLQEHIQRLVKELSQLSVLQMSQLKKQLEEAWGVQAAAPLAAAAAGAGEAAPSEAAAEATEFKVTLANVPADKKISLIKAVREITQLSLKESRDLVEQVPSTLKESVAKAEGEEICKKIAAAGGKADLVGVD